MKKLNTKAKIYIAGHTGMVGSSLLRLFKKQSFQNVILKKSSQLDLTNQYKTFNFLSREKPDYVIIAAAKVGGIKANNYKRAEFIYENLQIQNNLIHGSYITGVKNLIFLGSSCIYPKITKQPIKEKYLLTSPLEYTNEPYAIAKIAGLKLCENYNFQYGTNFKCLMPCNLYGPNDNFDLESSHFLPALLSKIYNAKINNQSSVLLWGNGKTKREIMHVDDLAQACLHFLKIDTEHTLINIGSGEEYSINQFANKISKFIGYKGKIIYNNELIGTPRKIIDSSIANKYGWISKINFNRGFESFYSYFKKQMK